jgi:hypothetical protein
MDTNIEMNINRAGKTRYQKLLCIGSITRVIRVLQGIDLDMRGSDNDMRKRHRGKITVCNDKNMH